MSDVYIKRWTWVVREPIFFYHLRLNGFVIFLIINVLVRHVLLARVCYRPGYMWVSFFILFFFHIAFEFESKKKKLFASDVLKYSIFRRICKCRLEQKLATKVRSVCRYGCAWVPHSYHASPLSVDPPTWRGSPHLPPFLSLSLPVAPHLMWQLFISAPAERPSASLGVVRPSRLLNACPGSSRTGNFHWIWAEKTFVCSPRFEERWWSQLFWSKGSLWIFMAFIRQESPEY